MVSFTLCSFSLALHIFYLFNFLIFISFLRISYNVFWLYSPLPPAPSSCAFLSLPARLCVFFLYIHIYIFLYIIFKTIKSNLCHSYTLGCVALPLEQGQPTRNHILKENRLSQHLAIASSSLASGDTSCPDPVSLFSWACTGLVCHQTTVSLEVQLPTGTRKHGSL